MNAETFCEHFATFADAPNGIAKLRAIVLQLAVQGKLVPQDADDESADVLLPAIREERIKRYGATRVISAVTAPNAEGPFALPSKWCWVQLSSVLLKLTDGTHRSPPNGPSGDFKYISAKNIRQPGVDLANVTYITAAHHQEIFSRCDPDLGDLLYVKDGATTGNVTINDLDEPFSLLSSVALLKVPSLISNRYLLQVLRSPFFYDAMRGDMSGVAITRVTLAKMEKALIPLPPLAEQRRIVEKVDQLLGLCDELAARQAAQREKRQRLVGATLDRLVSTRNPVEFPTHAHRLRNHFDQLFDTPTTIPQLRQTILQLAVQGQLVPQDPNDESASHLLEQIKGERLKLVAEKKISKSEPTPPVDESQILFSVPETWNWVRLPDVCHVITDGEHLTPQYAEAGIPMLSAKHVGSHSLLLEDFKLVSHATAAKCWSRCCPDERDILVVSRGGGVGRTIISGRRDYCLMGSVLLFKLASQVDERFLCYFLNSIQGNEKLRTTSGASAQQAIYIAHLKRDYVVPLPPLAEQKRIVTKVTELLSLCDALEAKLTQAESASTKLLSAAVHHLLNPTIRIEGPRIVGQPIIQS